MIQKTTFVKTIPLVTAAVLVLYAGVAWAHAILMSSSPATNAIVSGPNVDVDLKFNVRIDNKRSVIRLVTAEGDARSLPLVPASASNEILAKASDVQPGKYKLAWQALASDGHITRGEVPFSVR